MFDHPADQVRKLTVFGLDSVADALSVDLGYVAPRSMLGTVVFVGGTKSLKDSPKDSLSIRRASGADVFSVEAGRVVANGLAVGFSGVEEVILDAAGNDSLYGGPGNNGFLGGTGEEILIGGTTQDDAQAAALAATMNEWTATRRHIPRHAVNAPRGDRHTSFGITSRPRERGGA